MNALRVYDDRYIKTKIRTYSDEVFTNFRGLNVPEGDIECELLTFISADSFIHIQKYLDICADKIENKQMIILIKIFLKIRYYECCITIEFV